MMKSVGDLSGRRIGMLVLVIAASLLVSLAQMPVHATSNNSAATTCTPNFTLSGTSRNNTRGTESVFIVSITSVCGLSGSFGWDIALTAPSHTATNAPSLNQPTYHFTLGPDATRGVEFTAVTNQNTLLTTWTITVTVFGAGLRNTLNVTLTVTQ
jgi:hypothetical protein